MAGFKNENLKTGQKEWEAAVEEVGNHEANYSNKFCLITCDCVITWEII